MKPSVTERHTRRFGCRCCNCCDNEEIEADQGELNGFTQQILRARDDALGEQKTGGEGCREKSEENQREQEKEMYMTETEREMDQASNTICSHDLFEKRERRDAE